MKGFEKVSNLLYKELGGLLFLHIVHYLLAILDPNTSSWHKYIEIGIANKYVVLYYLIMLTVDIVLILSIYLVKKQKYVGGILSLLICIFELIYGGIILKIIVILVLVYTIIYLVKFPKEKSKQK